MNEGGRRPRRVSAFGWSDAKLTPPEPPARLAAHRRLFAALDAAMDKPLVWIHAPPGAGKTTLVSAWIAKRRFRSIWLRLDGEDSEPSNFFFGLARAEALSRGAPTTRLPLLTPGFRHAPLAFARRVSRALVSGDGAPEELVTVALDDYQQLSLDSIVHACLAAGVEELGRRGRILAISRAAPPKEFARHRVNGLVGVIDPERLRLDVSETRAVARVRGFKVEEPKILRAHEAAQGWTAGVILMLEAASAPPGPAPSPVMPELLFDYFAVEALGRFDASEQQALMSLSDMPTMSAAEAERLSGDPGAGAMLERLVREGFFTVRDSFHDPQYRFHPLFRDFLALSAARRFSDSERRRLSESAAAILSERGEPEAAVPLLKRSEDWRQLAAVIKTWAARLEASSRHRTFGAWIALLPRALVEEDGWLSYWAAVAEAPFAPPAARLNFKRALVLFDAAEDVTGVVLAGAALLDSIASDHVADRIELDPAFAILRAFLARHAELPSPSLDWRISFSMYGALAHRCNDRQELAYWRDRAFAAAKRVGGAAALWPVAALSVIHGSVDADYVRVRAWVAAMPRPEALAQTPEVQSFAYVAWIVAVSHRQAEGSVDELAVQAMRDAEASGVYGFTFAIATYAASESLRRGAPRRARYWVERIGEWMDRLSHIRGALYYYSACGLAVLEGDYPEAVRMGRRAVELGRAMHGAYFEALALINSIQALMAMQQPVAAAEQIRSLGAALDAGASASLRLACDLLSAENLRQTGSEAAALDRLKEALEHAERADLPRTLLLPPLASELLSRALVHGLSPAYVKTLIRNDDVKPAAERIEAWPWRLKILTLGRFTALRNGEPLFQSRKTPKRLVELMMAIVAFGAFDAPQDKVIDAVWPDEDGDTARQSFDIALHRLRKLIGDGQAIILRDGRIGFDPGCSWIDAYEFSAAVKRDFADEARLERALGFYQGDFLPAEAGRSWILAARRELQDLRGVASRALAALRAKRAHPDG
jgi:ATP/maltotriose-dependent transcriptional regulator MalT